MTWDYFPDHELRCKCGSCDEGGMNDEFMDKLVSMRDDFGFAFPLSSAFRCPAYNSVISRTGTTGPHTTGRAVDIKIFGKNAFKISGAAEAYGFTGVGVKQKGPHHLRFIHLDDLEEPEHSPRPWIWSY